MRYKTLKLFKMGGYRPPHNNNNREIENQLLEIAKLSNNLPCLSLDPINVVASVNKTHLNHWLHYILFDQNNHWVTCMSMVVVTQINTNCLYHNQLWFYLTTQAPKRGTVRRKLILVVFPYFHVRCLLTEFL